MPTGENQLLKLLLVEDDEGDYALMQEIQFESEKKHFDLERVDRLSACLEKLKEPIFDAVLLDLGLPDSQGLTTFSRVREVFPEIPIIVLSGLADETIALKAVQLGAQDYLMKGNIHSDLLKRSIRYAIERQKLFIQLQKSLKEIKTLRGLLPICAHCKKIRDDKGYWNQIESYISVRSEAQFSHGICPECVKILYPDIDLDT